ncbi:MAG: helix-turn-helix domain-containing protein [Bacteroidaceae bacterium]|nr:helix-turn-helix domain-containing protein [Bacteroidaceae bacterium]
MDDDQEHIIIASTLEDIGRGRLANYLCHAYCHEGCCTFTYSNKVFTLAAGDCLILRRGDLVESLHPTEDFRVSVIYVTPEFIEISTPQSNYGMKGSLALFQNPVMHLTPDQQKVCVLDFDYIQRRLAYSRHNFHRDAMINAVQCMIIDFFDFHAQQNGLGEKITTQYAQVMQQFLELLERGDYRKNREIGYYADKLCVTTKYLSEVSKKVSGYAANYWINRYTALDISRQLRYRNKTLTELTDLYGFSSPSYFTRYVQKFLGVSPSDLRE